MTRLALTALLLTSCLPSPAESKPPVPKIEPLVRVVDLDVGQSSQVELCDGRQVSVKLLEVKETADPVRHAVRNARVRIEINGRQLWLTSANYALPETVAGVQIDCPITGGYKRNSTRDRWQLEADARLRLWPAGSPLVRPGTFVYPVAQRWFASNTQMANEPCYVNACELPSATKIYYHDGLDFGGAEGLVDVLSSTDGLVVSARNETLPGYEETPVSPRYDVVYVLDQRGWYYRYSHLHVINESIQPGTLVIAGQRLGLLGKEGGSGGWTHLHFGITSLQPSGEWGTQEAYAFVWEAYRRQFAPKLVAVARPHHLTFAGRKIVLDASRSFSADNSIVDYHWTFTDGTTAEGERIDRVYHKPGHYSEVLKVTDAAGRIDYDFAVVQVIDPEAPEPVPPSIHAVYYPTFGIRPGDEVTFKVRTFGTTHGQETWDFGDGSPAATSRSDGCVEKLNPDGYAILKHRYQEPGHYLVRVERSDPKGRPAVGHVQVRVGTASN